MPAPIMEIRGHGPLLHNLRKPSKPIYYTSAIKRR